MKTSKIKNVVNKSQPYGKAIYYDVEMDNGDKINVGLPIDLDLKSEITYKITGDGQQEYDKAECDWKTGIKRPQGSAQVKGGFDPNTSLYQTCLKGVMDFAIATHNPQFKDEPFTSENINNLALEIALKAKENISKL